MAIIGKATINPIIFYSGKFSGFFSWAVSILAVFDSPNLFIINEFYYNKIISLALIAIGLVFSVISLINLGKSTRVGLPNEETSFKTKGIYSISRNPMYVGFNLITLSSVIYTANFWITILGIYSIIVHHFIILGEEKFLKNRFGNEFIRYKTRVRRYF